MSECLVCKSKVKSLLYCNGCFQRAKDKAKHEGAVEELREIKKWIEKQSHISFDRFSNKKEMEYVTSYEVCELILKEFEKRLLEMKQKQNHTNL